MLKIGDVLDNTYEIKSQIGSGGGGIIYKGYHLRMCIPVAIKLMKSEAKGIIDQRSEVDLLKQLKNDYIPQVLDFIIDGNDVYTVMEFVEGSNFKQLITSGRTFSENDVLRYIKQLCTAVKYLHDHNPPIIHSDIKPTNIMLKPDDSICLIDFNISTVVSENGAYSVGGSKGFAAPEQFRKVIDIPVVVDEFHEETRFLGLDDETEFLDGSDSSSEASLKTKNVSKAYVDMRTDIYGIGSSMYYMLTGRVPTTGKTDFRGVKVSSKTQKIIKKCMNPDPAKRFANVRELEHALSSKGSAAIIAAVAAVLIISIGAVAVINNNSTAGIESDINNGFSENDFSAASEESTTTEVVTVEKDEIIESEIPISETTTSQNVTTSVTTTTPEETTKKTTKTSKSSAEEKITTTKTTTMPPKVTTAATTTTPKVTTAATTTTPKVTTAATTTTPKVTTAATTTTPKETTTADTSAAVLSEYIYAVGDFTAEKKDGHYVVNPGPFIYDQMSLELLYYDKEMDSLISCGTVYYTWTGKKLEDSREKYADGSIVLDFDNTWVGNNDSPCVINQIATKALRMDVKKKGFPSIGEEQYACFFNPDPIKKTVDFSYLYINYDKRVESLNKLIESYGYTYYFIGDTYNQKGEYVDTKETKEITEGIKNLKPTIYDLHGEYIFRYVFTDKYGDKKYSDMIYRKIE